MDLEWPGELGTEPISWALEPASRAGFQLKNDMEKRIVMQGGGRALMTCCPHLPAKVTGLCSSGRRVSPLARWVRETERDERCININPAQPSGSHGFRRAQSCSYKKLSADASRKGPKAAPPAIRDLFQPPSPECGPSGLLRADQESWTSAGRGPGWAVLH